MSAAADFARLVAGDVPDDLRLAISRPPSWRAEPYRSAEGLAGINGTSGEAYIRATLVHADVHRGRGSAADTRAVVGLWMDVDVDGTPDGKGGTKTGAAPSVHHAEDLLYEIARPSVVVASGGGLHAWWLLAARPVRLDETGLAAFAQLEYDWLEAHRAIVDWRIDATHDLARVLRLPGTVNLKGGPPGAPVAERDRTGAEYTLDELRGLVPETPMPVAAHAASIGPAVQPSGVAIVTDARLARLLQRPPGDQSADDHAIACRAVELGYPDDEIAQLIIGRRRGTGSTKADQRPDYLARTIAAAQLSVGRDETPPDDPDRVTANPLDLGLDDIGNASRFVHQHGDVVRYAAPLEAWLVWDETRWVVDDRQAVIDLAKTTARRILAEAALESDDDHRKALVRHAHASARKQRVDAMLALARPDVAVVPSELDRDGWLLNTPGGTVDLRTGQLRAHDRSDLITRTTGTTPSGDAPIWEAFLERVLPDPDVRSYLQRLAGVSLIGETVEHVLPILHGSGANGKSTLAETLRGALGDYAHTAPVDLLMQGRRDTGAATPEVAQLRGRRLVLVSETKEDGRLAAERVKSLTGGDTQTARLLHGNPFSFRPSHSAWLLTNHRPRIEDDGSAIWRRIALIRFDVVIPPADRDGALPAKLAREAAGVLRWCIDGCLSYQRDGLAMPPAVEAATHEYRTAEDTFGVFLHERTQTGGSVKAGDLHAAYTAWAAENSTQKLSPLAMAERLEARGYRARRTNTARYWDGLNLGTVIP